MTTNVSNPSPAVPTKILNLDNTGQIVATRASAGSTSDSAVFTITAALLRTYAYLVISNIVKATCASTGANSSCVLTIKTCETGGTPTQRFSSALLSFPSPASASAGVVCQTVDYVHTLQAAEIANGIEITVEVTANQGGTGDVTAEVLQTATWGAL